MAPGRATVYAGHVAQKHQTPYPVESRLVRFDHDRIFLSTVHGGHGPQVQRARHQPGAGHGLAEH